MNSLPNKTLVDSTAHLKQIHGRNRPSYVAEINAGIVAADAAGGKEGVLAYLQAKQVELFVRYPCLSGPLSAAAEKVRSHVQNVLDFARAVTE
jgi:hypothetical protein